jgi:glycerophosphoryl diester phosphodiesterase
MDGQLDDRAERPTAREIVAASRLLAIAHRGASHIAPENTLPAFQAALDLNVNQDTDPSVDLIELDYQESAEAVPVVFHDENLDRTTDACRQWKQTKIPLAAKSLVDLRTLDAGTWFSQRFVGTRIPTLAEALDLITTGSIALVERKAGSPQRFIETVRACAAIDRVVLQAFDWNFLAECRRLAPEMVLAALGEHELTTGRLNEIVQLQIPVVAWDHEQLTPETIAAIHTCGLKCWTWTVDEPDRMQRLADWGVDGIITNRPDLLQAIRLGRLR